MYSARLATPASGFVVQLVAPNVSAAHRASFVDYATTAGECPPAMEVSAKASDFESLSAQWQGGARAHWRAVLRGRGLLMAAASREGLPLRWGN